MSFRKRNADQQPKLPSGSRLSAYNGQLLISTGVPSLDDIMGGGLPVGTVLLIKEDRATTYAQLLLKYFLAQGVASGHHCALASRDEDGNELLRNLMWLATSSTNDDDEDHDEAAKSAARSNAEGDRLKIAWRYAHLKKFESGVRQGKAIIFSFYSNGIRSVLFDSVLLLVFFYIHFVAPPSPSPQTSSSSVDSKSSTANNEPKPYCSLFDLTKRVPESILEESEPTVLDNADGEDDYATLLENIRKLVLENNFR